MNEESLQELKKKHRKQNKFCIMGLQKEKRKRKGHKVYLSYNCWKPPKHGEKNEHTYPQGLKTQRIWTWLGLTKTH